MGLMKRPELQWSKPMHSERKFYRCIIVALFYHSFFVFMQYLYQVVRKDSFGILRNIKYVPNLSDICPHVIFAFFVFILCNTRLVKFIF